MDAWVDQNEFQREIVSKYLISRQREYEIIYQIHLLSFRVIEIETDLLVSIRYTGTPIFHCIVLMVMKTIWFNEIE